MVLIAIGLGWISGMAPIAAWGAPWWMGAAWLVAITPALITVGPLRGRHVLAVSLILAGLVSGLRLEFGTGPSVPPWKTLLGQDVRVTGVVESEPRRGDITTGYVVRIETMTGAVGDSYSGGRAMAYLNQYDAYLPGDTLTLEGRLDEPPRFEGFDYRAYLARNGISATLFRPNVISAEAGDASLSRLLTRARLKLDISLRRSLPEPASSLASGIAFGRDDGLSSAEKENFNRAGLRHLVAVSGSNVTIVAAFVYLLAVPTVGRRWAWVPAALAIAGYLGAAGFSPSVLRAGLMALTFLVGSVIGRPQSGLPALLAATIGMTAASPGLATDSGFLLSATATGGIITLFPHFDVRLRRVTAGWRYLPVPVWVCQAAALTLAATVATMPIMWVTFGRISLVSPIANVVVEPVFVLAFWASVATSILGLVSESLGAMVGSVGYYPLAFISGSASVFADLPGSSVATRGGSATAALTAYFVLAPLALVAYRYPPLPEEEPVAVRNRRSKATRFVGGAAVGSIFVSVFQLFINSGHGNAELSVRFFDVGQGDATLITTPHGRQVLIDGGPSGLRLTRNMGTAMPHSDRSIDVVILSHPQEDHMAGFPLLTQRYKPGLVYDNGRVNGTGTYRYYDEALPERSTLEAGGEFSIDGVRFQVLWPSADFVASNLNETSLVLRVTYGRVSILLTGDIEEPAIQLLVTEKSVRADVLKVPHHGSKTTPAWFFEAVSPSLAVISVGTDNFFGHPHPDTLAALLPYRVARTDQVGTVTVSTDGIHIEVSGRR